MVGAHEGRKSGSDTGRGGYAALRAPMGLWGKERRAKPLEHPNGQVGGTAFVFIGAEMGGMVWDTQALDYGFLTPGREET
jgi:hypothetical protein